MSKIELATLNEGWTKWQNDIVDGCVNVYEYLGAYMLVCACVYAWLRINMNYTFTTIAQVTKDLIIHVWVGN